MGNKGVASGKWAEEYAAVWLSRSGFTILVTNWRNRFVEVDIIAKKDSIIYLVEVKFRKSAAYGAASEYITTKKKHQMIKAAAHWQAESGWSGDMRISVFAITLKDGKHDVIFLPSAITVD